MHLAPRTTIYKRPSAAAAVCSRGCVHVCVCVSSRATMSERRTRYPHKNTISLIKTNSVSLRSRYLPATTERLARRWRRRRQPPPAQCIYLCIATERTNERIFVRSSRLHRRDADVHSTKRRYSWGGLRCRAPCTVRAIRPPRAVQPRLPNNATPTA